jgi:TonB family protein
MKSAFVLAILIFSLSFCNLAQKLANRNQNEDASTSLNTNQPAVNSSPSVETSPPPPPAMNQNTTANSSSAIISGGALDGKAISKPDPAYPAVAKSVRASGTVVVQVTVDETGKVISAEATSGHPLLRAAAVQAARQAQFKPTLVSGKPVKVIGTLTYNFKLQ